MPNDLCTLAHAWDGSRDLTGWLLSEKLDGVRALWDGEKFVSRNGKPLNAPAWFLERLPKIALDGELFIDRGRFQELVGIVRKKVPVDSEWAKVRYMVFDAPTHLAAPFTERLYVARMSLLGHQVVNGFAQGVGVKVVNHIQCESNEHARRYVEDLVSCGAEGVMARRPDSLWTPGRSHDLLKIKKFQDSEGVVTGYELGKGKHKGRVGALLCRMLYPNPVTGERDTPGKDFKVGTGLTDAERENPPKVGSFITYRYFELTKDGVPRFPSFVSVRDYE